MNKETMAVLLRIVRNGSNDGLAYVAESLIKEISRIFPGLYRTQLDNFSETILSGTNEDGGIYEF